MSVTVGGRRSRPTIPTSWHLRSAPVRGALVGAILALAICVGPAYASVIGQEHYSGSDSWSYDDCGFWVDVAAEWGGVAHLRVGKGDDASAFFLHDNYWWRETHRVRGTDRWIVVSGNGVFQETKAIRTEGNVFTFTAVNAGQPFRITDAWGNVLLRDRGVVRETILFDTLGDDTPGGEFLGTLDFSVAGPHPGLDVDICEYLD